METAVAKRASRTRQLAHLSGDRVERARSLFVRSVGDCKRSYLRVIFDQLLESRTRGEISDAQVAEIMELVLTRYIESEVEAQVHERVSKALTKLNLNILN